LGEASDGSGRVVNDVRAVKAEDARALGEVAVVANVHADAGVTGLEDGVAGVSGREIKLLPKARVTMRNVVLAVFAEVTAVGVDDRGSVEVNAGHFHFVNGDDEDHLVLFGEFLHQRDGGSIGDAFGQFVPASLLLGAKVRAIEEFLQAEDLHFFLGGVGDQALRSEEHTSELQSRSDLVCRLLLEKKNKTQYIQ